MKPQEKKLLNLFRELPEAERQTLLDFASFLNHRHNEARASLPPSKPQPLPRPEKESVIAAIKRLSAGYPMLDKARMLNETSLLVTQHVMQGRPAVEVIDELELVFERHYQQLLTETDQ